MSPQKENGFTPIANELFEAFYRCKLTEYERCVVMCIWRKTYGWNKKEDWVSNSQIEKETGISLPNTTRTIKLLRAKNILHKNSNRVGVNKKYKEWKVDWRRLSHQTTYVVSPDNKRLSHQTPTKEKKETIQKSAEPSSEKSLTDNLEKMWNKVSDDFEGELQIDPDYTPKGKKKVKKVSDDVQAVFELFNNPASALWRMREIERVAAQALFDSYGLDKLKVRVNRINEEKQKKDPFFPDINTPSQLLDKMPNVERYLNI